MKYFTAQRYARLQETGREEMDAGDAAWEEAVIRYDEHLQRLRPELPEGARRLLDDVYLQDAEVLSMGRQGATFVVVLRLPAPPQNLLVVTYDLTEPPAIDADALPAESRSIRVQWLVDELDWAAHDSPHFCHTILFSNGWQVCLSFRAVQVLVVQAVYPAPTLTAAAQQFTS